MPNPRGLPIAESVQFGWNTLKPNLLFLVGVTLVACLVPSLIDWAGGHVLDSRLQQIGVSAISSLVSSLFTLGLARIYLKFRDGEKPVFENLFDVLSRLHIYIAAMIIVCIAVAMGFLLLVVPGIILMLRLWFVAFIIVDERVGPLEAIQRSWDITRGHTGSLLLLFFALVGLIILGALALLVGVLIAIPICGLAEAYVYRHLNPKVAAAPNAVSTAL